MMKLIVEDVDLGAIDILAELNEETKAKTYRIKGPFLQAETKNKNGRVYSLPILEREVKQFTKEKINAKRALGELDHPPTPTVNLQNVSHMIESLTMEGNDGIGTAKVLDTPKGKIAQCLLDQGVKLGVSTRGVGSLDGSKVNEDYKLITVDLVCDPSAPNAFVEGVLENKEWMIDGNAIVEVAVEKLQAEADRKFKKDNMYSAVSEFLDDIRDSWQ